MKRKQKKQQPRRAVLETIEPRILYSADFAPGLVPDHGVAPEAEQRTLDPTGEFTQAAEQPVQTRRHELVLVETNTPDYQKLVDDILKQAGEGREIEVVVLDASQDGIAQISDIMAARQDLDAVHLISYGASGQVQLGSTSLNFDTLLKSAAQIKGWGNSLSADADFLLYGCDIAQDAEGRALVDALSRLTGADVAASVDLTGNALRGGDWDLEYNAGQMETAIAVSPVAQQTWQGLLDITTALKGIWTLDADANDTSGNGYHGTLTNGAAIDTTPGTNKVGAGKGSFDGVNDYVDLSAHRANFTGLTQGTIAAWIKTSQAGSDATIFDFSDIADANSWASLYLTGGKLDFGVSEASTELLGVKSTASVADNVWHHVAVTVDATGNKLYIDGVQAAVTYTTGTAATQKFISDVTGIDIMWIGGDRNNGGLRSMFTGLIDDVRVYDRALSATDIAQLSTLVPTITDLSGDALIYSAASGAVVIDQSSAAGVADIDSADFNTGTLTVSFAAGSDSAEDVLAIRNQGTGAGQIGVSGANVTYAGTTIGTWTGGSGGSNLVITLNASANPTNTAALLQNITFQDTDAASPTIGQRSVRFVLTDGDGGTSANYDATVDVTAVNDAPAFGTGIVTTAIGAGDDRGYASALQADGKIVVAGYSFNGTDNDFAVVRYNTDGSLDTSFSGDGKLTTAIGSGDDRATSVVVQSDGKIVVAGYSFSGTDNDFAVVRYNADGSLDTTFSGDGKLTTAIGSGADVANSVALQADGKIVAVGDSNNGTTIDFAVVRYNTDGSLDTTFSGDGKLTTVIGTDHILGDVVVQGDGKIVVGGRSKSTTNDYTVVRYNTDGSLDTTFSGDGKVTTPIGPALDSGHSLALQADGKILLGGYYYNGSGDSFAVIRYNTDGSLDTTFSGDGIATTAFTTNYNEAYGIAVQTDGTIVIAGEFGKTGAGVTTSDFAVVRFNADGSLDTTFSDDGMLTTAIGSGDDTGRSVLLQADGKIVVAGYSYDGTNYDFAAVRYNTDGSLDRSFNNLNGTPTYIENGVAVVFDSDVVVYDNELSAADNFAGATLTLARQSGANAQDVFGNSGSLGALTQGGNLVLAGTTIGAVTTNSGGTLVLTFNGSATQARVNSTLRLLTYANTSDAPPASVQIDWTFNDGNAGAQGSGGALSGTGSITVSITAVNDAPVGTNKTVTTLEDTDYVFTVADFGFTDPTDSPVNALANVKITTLPGAGTLTLSGVALTAGQFVSAANITAGNLKFTPAANANGAAYASFTFQVQDDGGTANGGIDLDATPRTMTVNVTSVNDAPIGTNKTVTTLEDTVYTFSAADFGFTDPSDSPVNALLNVKITTLPGAGALELSGVAVTAGQFVSVANVAAGNLKFTPVANANGAGYASFTFQVQDDGGTANSGVDLDTAARTMTVNVTSVNDAPIGTNKTVTTLEDTVYTFSAADFGFTDPSDSPVNALLNVKITTLPGAGALELSGVAVTAGQFVSVANVAAGNLKFTPAANANGVAYAAFTFQVQDDGGTANAGVDLDSAARTMTVDVTAVSEAPVVSAGASTGYTENAAGVAIDTTITVNDADDTQIAGATVSISAGLSAGDVLGFVNTAGISGAYNAGTGVLTLSGTDTLANYQAALRTVTYGSTSEDPTAVGTIRTIDWQVTDANSGGAGAASSVVVTSTINLTALADAPVLSAGPTTGYTENAAAVAIDSTITVSDADDTQIASATVTISAGLTAGDMLSFVNTASITGVYNAGTGVLTLSGTDTLANYQGALRSVTYRSTSEDPTATSASRTIDWQVSDANSDATAAQTSALVTSTVNLTALADAPVLSAGASAAYTENAAAVAIDPTLTVNDADDTQISGATVSISAGLSAGDLLGFVNTAGISGAYNAGTGVLTLSGTDTLANYQAALRTLTYSSTSQDPTALSASRTIDWQVTDANSDSAGAATSVAVTSSVNLSALADAPVLSAGAVTAYTENAAGAVIDNTITIVDADDTQLTGATVSISAGLTAGDVLGFVNTAGISGSYNAGTGVLTLTGTDTLVNYQAGLRSVTYSSTSEDPTAASASRTIGWQVTDANSAGAGAQTSAVVTSSVNLSALADAPVLSAGAIASYTENAAAVVIDNTLSVNDADDTQITGATVSISAGLSAGDVLGFVNTASITGSYNAGIGVLTLTGTDTLANYEAVLRGVTYRSTSEDPTATSASRTIDWQITDANSEGAGAASSVSVASMLNVTPVNDAPVLGANALTIDQGGSVVLGPSTLSASDVDTPAGALSFSVSNVMNGRFERTSAPGLAVSLFTQAEVLAGQVRFVHNGSATLPGYDVQVDDGALSIGPFAASVSFNPAPALSGPPALIPPLPAVVPPPPAPSAEEVLDSEAADQPGDALVEAAFTPGGAPANFNDISEISVRLAKVEARVARARLPTPQAEAKLNDYTLAQSIQLDVQMFNLLPAQLNYTPSTPVDWLVASAFEEGAGEHLRDDLQVLIDSVKFGGMGLSVGVVWWASRISALLGSLVASTPAWSHIDPLPVVGNDEDDEDKWLEPDDRDTDANELAVSMVLDGGRSTTREAD